MKVRGLLALFSFCLLISILAYGVCPVYTQVDPQAGENIWKITSRIGSTLDDLLYTTSLNSECTCFITQADVPGMVISKPGVYCLSENITIPAAAGVVVIDVQSDNVVIDFRGYSITAVNTPAVIQVADHNYAVIKNASLITSGANAISLTRAQFVVINNCVITNTGGNGISWLGRTDGGISMGLLVDACLAEACSGFGFYITGAGGGILIKNCMATRNHRGFVIDGVSSDWSPFGVYLQSCYATSNVGYGFSASNFVSGITFNSCTAFGSQGVGEGDGFYIDSYVTNLTNCVGDANFRHGFNLNPSSDIQKEINVIGCSATLNVGVGIHNNAGTIGLIFNNIANTNSISNYSGVTAGTIVSSGSVTSTTGYWANISG